MYQDKVEHADSPTIEHLRRIAIKRQNSELLLIRKRRRFSVIRVARGSRCGAGEGCSLVFPARRLPMPPQREDDGSNDHSRRFATPKHRVRRQSPRLARQRMSSLKAVGIGAVGSEEQVTTRPTLRPGVVQNLLSRCSRILEKIDHEDTSFP